ncbi:hypothetical protein I79_020963 [Cricetulus griseus]|uniref:Uncharacterized protein n=1 Tax=Cricetulus griseus TaxID=10029 RepID=G3IBE3_CRIGR|nr:hypothetical protein I79_020963 [Cricetulus griseus]
MGHLVDRHRAAVLASPNLNISQDIRALFTNLVKQPAVLWTKRLVSAKASRHRKSLGEKIREKVSL